MSKPKSVRSAKNLPVPSRYVPTDDERHHLVQLLGTPGWDVVQKIGVAAQEEFWDVLRKLNPLGRDYAEQLQTAARRADCAQTLWEEFARRIEEAAAIEEHARAKGQHPTKQDAIPDITEGVL